MKKIISFIITFSILFCFSCCNGNFSNINLNDPVLIPENGIISEDIIEKIKSTNSIAVFFGYYDEIYYEWTIFGSDIVNTADINLSVIIEDKDEFISLDFNQKDDFGFPALLSIHMNKKYTYAAATAYSDNKPIYSVSVTGSKNSILNISVNKIVDNCDILFDNNILTDNNEQDIQVQSQNNYPSDNLTENRNYSDGNNTEQDKYKTDPVPEGKPMPVEPENQTIDEKISYTCTFSIECSTILNNITDLDPDKLELITSDGVIFPASTVTFYEGESVFDVLQRVCRENNIHMEASWTPVYNSAYIEGINNLYEFDCGSLSGWMYSVNGWYPNYGCSRYQLADGEQVCWRYTCDLGKDVGCDWMNQ